MEPIDLSSFACPRCEQPAQGDYYGPCPSCRENLRGLYTAEARTEAVASAYEPKMNVTPNAVATKD